MEGIRGTATSDISGTTSSLPGSEYSELYACLVCTSRRLVPVLDLGAQPLANEYLGEGQLASSYALALNRCAACYHTQLSISVSPERLFSNYLYASGTTRTLREYFTWFTEQFVSAHREGAKVLEIASNDGSFLEILQSKGHHGVGVDPAANLVALAAAKGVVTVCDFWPGRIATSLKQDFDIVVAMNVLAHVPDPLEFLINCKAVTKDQGRILIQTSQAMMFHRSEFDTIYHEHLSFFNTRSMMTLASRAELKLSQVDLTDIHGTSCVWTLQPDDGSESVPDSVHEAILRESRWGLYDSETYVSFAGRARERIDETSRIVDLAVARGFRVYLYGSAAKAMTFLNASDMTLDGVLDDNPLKQGLEAPGGHGIVQSFESIAAESQPVVFLIGAWNFRDEIISRATAMRDGHGDLFLTYFPQISLVDAQGHDALPGFSLGSLGDIT